MKVDRLRDAAEFLAATQDLRAAEPVLTNLPGSIALSVVNGRKYHAEYWWVVRDEDGTVVGCALRTAPHRLVLSPMPAAAARELGSVVAAEDPAIPGANGLHEVVDAFYAGLASPLLPRVTMTDVIYVLAHLVPPAVVSGRARRANMADLALLLDWSLQFQVDAGLPSSDVSASVPPRVAAGALWLWDVDGTPVAMAGHADPVETPSGKVVRIGPVYTPEPLRRKGFGAAVSAAIIESVLTRATTVMLFADAANPTSNALYLRLGFRPVGEVVETALE